MEHKEDIFFVDTKNFPIIEEELLTQSPVVLWRVYKSTKNSVWLTDQRILCWLQLKPNLQTFWYLKETDGLEHDIGNLKTPGRGCWNLLRSDSQHHRAASDAYSVITIFIGWFVEAVTINVLVSNKVEVPLTEMKYLVIGSYVFPIREVSKKM